MRRLRRTQLALERRHERHDSVLCPGAVNTGIGANSVRQHRAVVGKAPGEHNAPDPTSADGPQVPIKEGSQSGKKLGDKMSSALSRGMQPDDVGRLVLDAILTDKFWIFTDPSLLRVAQEQLELSISDRLLSRGRLV